MSPYQTSSAESAAGEAESAAEACGAASHTSCTQTSAKVNPETLEVTDDVTGWKLPKPSPKELELTVEEYDQLKKRLSIPDDPRIPRYNQEDLEKKGWKCWLEYKLHSYAAWL
jgi:hypothetical protein